MGTPEDDSAARKLSGELHVSDGGTFMIVDADARRGVRARQADAREKVVADRADLEPRWIWTVTLDADAAVEDVELDDERWLALFNQPHRRGEAPSVHNSWCKQCTSVGVSHGVCC